MRLLPIFVKLSERRVVVIGAGKVGAQKIAQVLACGATVRAIAPGAVARVRGWARRGKIQWLRRKFDVRDVAGADLVIGATSSPETNRAIFLATRAQGVLCNIVDDPKHCDFYFPAMLRRGDLQIAVSTGGQSPALAQKVRDELREKYGAEYGRRLRALGRARRGILRAQWPSRKRTALLKRMANTAAVELAARRPA